jgi:hypothetical protein
MAMPVRESVSCVLMCVSSCACACVCAGCVRADRPGIPLGSHAITVRTRIHPLVYLCLWECSCACFRASVGSCCICECVCLSSLALHTHTHARTHTQVGPDHRLHAGLHLRRRRDGVPRGGLGVDGHQGPVQCTCVRACEYAWCVCDDGRGARRSRIWVDSPMLGGPRPLTDSWSMSVPPCAHVSIAARAFVAVFVCLCIRGLAPWQTGGLSWAAMTVSFSIMTGLGAYIRACVLYTLTYMWCMCAHVHLCVFAHISYAAPHGHAGADHTQ